MTINNISAAWFEELRQKPDGERFVALKSAASLKEEGYTKKEAQQMLDAKRFSSQIVDSVLEEVYDPGVLNQNNTSNSTVVMACPNSYREVAPLVASALRQRTAKEFIDLLACSDDPILKVSNKSLSSWYRLASQAKQDSYALNILHNDLKPWIEEAMCASVLASRSNDFGKLKIANRNANNCTYLDGNTEVLVNLEAGTCSCSKFVKSNFGVFGLACEHMIKFAEAVSPFTRLKRAITL